MGHVKMMWSETPNASAQAFGCSGQTQSNRSYTDPRNVDTEP